MIASEDPVERLKKAKGLLDAGLISDFEFETIKARVVSQF
ncbi:SHOCT domain-containing protein [Paraburkholderia caballeronis]|nr:SHOCT domain-containing protein [Paraburkholderia caballeronis]